METLFGLAVGVGLSAACGFRVFVPLLGMSIAAQAGYLALSPGFEWIGFREALVAFCAATAIEIAAYYIPWLDNLLDSLTTPLAVAASTVLTASLLGDIPPFLKWSLAVIAGGGVAAIVQSGTVALRAASTGVTGGLTNVLVATVELLASILTTVLAIILPLLAFVAAIWLCWRLMVVLLRSKRAKRLSG